MYLEKLYNEVISGVDKNIVIDYKPSKFEVTTWLDKILTSGKPISRAFINHSDIICEIIPEMKECVGFWQNNKYHKHNVYEHLLAVTDYCKTDKFIIKLAALLHDIGKPQSYSEDSEGHGHFYGHPEVSYDICKATVVDRFELSNEEKERLLMLIRYHDMIVTNDDKSVNKAYNKFGEDFINDWVILKEADLADHIFPKGKPKWFTRADEITGIVQRIIVAEQAERRNKLKVDGNDIMNLLNIPEGKQVGNILSALKEEVLLGKISNESEILLKRASELSGIMP